MKQKFVLGLLWSGCLAVGVLMGLAFANSAAGAAAAAPSPEQPAPTTKPAAANIRAAAPKQTNRAKPASTAKPRTPTTITPTGKPAPRR